MICRLCEKELLDQEWIVGISGARKSYQMGVSHFACMLRLLTVRPDLYGG